MGIYFVGPFSSADFAAGQKEKENEAAGCMREVERRGSPPNIPFTPLTILPVADEISTNKQGDQFFQSW